MEESAKLCYVKSRFQIDAKLQDFPAGLEKCGKTGPPMRNEQIERSDRQHLWMMTSRQQHLKLIVPDELEQHPAMNSARLITHEQVRSEIQAFMEEVRRSQFALKTVASKITSDPMEVDSFGKGSKTKARRARKEKVMSDGRNVKKEGQHQNQTSESKQGCCLLALR